MYVLNNYYYFYYNYFIIGICKKCIVKNIFNNICNKIVQIQIMQLNCNLLFALIEI